MDYTLNRLTNTQEEELKFDETPYAEFENLKFTTLEDGTPVFDATEYYVLSEIEPIGYRLFSRTSKIYIERLLEDTELERGKLFFQNVNGHELYHAALAPIFLVFASKEAFLYFYSMLNDLLLEGYAFADTYIMSITARRVPTEMLKEIIKQRENGEEENSANDV